MFGHVVPKKGIGEQGFVVDVSVEDVKLLMYTKITLKTDYGQAMLKLLVELLRKLRIHGLEKVTGENSPEYDPHANGDAEIGVQIVKACSGRTEWSWRMSSGTVCRLFAL